MLSRHELAVPQEDIARVQPTGDAVKPSALGEIADWDLGGAQRLDCLRRELHVAKEVHLRDLAQANLLLHLVAVFHLDYLARLSHAEPLRIQVQRTQFITRRNHWADLRLD